ncbi:hypothetical protein M409DRAFT_21037 [Zasmidium cellare ATCC 36951]|uniref:Aspartate racemase n=1 Tax=Zasmidium cellare ATCC 36951 TaxID=1080233 RepID=A0A6A6CU72_ZASCE|nr:uncharacterized protein M409DRAFT_21037 [Zasmidium cellare ATCC 36951]KAF2169026.1 hypothetical protein M409DRAFT_21037 [Zasmidium cellare ATCC 36951]
MKTVALLGGMTYEASAVYYKVINDHIRQRLGGRFSAPLLLHSFNFQPLLEHMNQGRWDSVVEIFASALSHMKAAGAEAFVICANYPHKVAERVSELSSLEFLHIADFTAEEILRKGQRRIGLLGTRMVMEEGYIKDRMRDKFGVEVLVPEDQETRDRVHSELMDNLPSGRVSSELREILIGSARRMVEQGAQGIVLGSTDLAFALKPEDLDVVLFDTNVLHAKGVAEWMIEATDVD